MGSAQHLDIAYTSIRRMLHSISALRHEWRLSGVAALTAYGAALHFCDPSSGFSVMGRSIREADLPIHEHSGTVETP